MKKIYIAVLACIINAAAIAQISITQNDMPHPGDSARYTNAVLNLFINYAATGPNHTWDFHNLRAASQGLEDYQSVGSTNIVYSLFFLNIGFNPNRSSVASNTTEPPTNPLISLDNPYNFYYLNSSQYRQVGFGAEIAGIPIPIAYNNKDIIYNLPINFGDMDTSDSDWNINIPGTGYMGYNQTRMNDVDGWGTLITPLDTFNVLRVKTTRAQRDTFAIDTLPGLGIDRLLINEYKWLTNGEIIPVLQITTQTIFGLEVVTNIRFRDDFIRIETDPLSNNVFCAGSTITIPYTKFGTFNGNALFSPGNVFTAQLSDSSGSFANPVDIGNVTSIQSGAITATIPSGTIPGTHYRIRVVSSNLPVDGSDNGTDITIINTGPSINAISASGPLTFCYPGTVTLSIDTGAYYSYQWFNNGSAISNAVNFDFIANTTGVYTVDVSNACGTVTSGSVTVTVDSLPIVNISTAGTAPCQGDTVLITSSVSNALSLQWQLNGVDINGETGVDLLVTQDGNYSLVASNACGNSSSSTLSLSFGLPPGIPVVTAANNSICAGDSILLNGSADAGTSLQWQLNGTDITGGIDSMLFVNSAGDYTLTSTNACGLAVSSLFNITVNTVPATPLISASGNSICAGDSILLNGSTTPGSTLQWELNGASISGANDSMLYANAAGDYTLTASNSCGSTTSLIYSITINTSPSTPTVTASNTSMCAGDSILLNGSAQAGTTLQWQLNGTDINGAIDSMLYVFTGGDYTLTATNSCGSTTSALFNITVNTAPPTPMINAASNSICSGDSVLLNGSALPGSALQWQLNGTDITGAIDSTWYANLAGDYTLTATNACGSSVSALFNITVNPLPATPIVTSSGTSTCAGDSILLSASGSAGITWQWQLNGADINGATDSTYYANTSGNYTVTAINSCGTAVSAALTITINPLPPAPIITQGLDTLYATGTGLFQWYFNGTPIAGATNAYYVVTQNGNYTVTVTDANGCQSGSIVYPYNSVGIMETGDAGVSIYPNPVYGSSLNINWNKNKRIINVSIINMVGQQVSVYSVISGQSHLVIDASHFDSGMYHIQLLTDSGIYKTKFVKQ